MFKRNALLERYLKQASSEDINVAQASLRKIAKALELPLRQALLDEDIVTPIFEAQDYRGKRFVEMPLDFLQPGQENQFTAFAVPDCGCIPENPVQGDYILVPTYKIANSIDWCFEYAEDADWNVVARANEVLIQGMVKKKNDDGWHVIEAAAADRNMIVHNPDAPAGYFSKSLLSMTQVAMRRNGGGNSGTLNRFRLTDVYMSPEAMASIRSWPFTEVDDVTRREILQGANCDQGLAQLFCVNLHELDELGVGQEYQLFWTADLAKTLPGATNEIAFGLDLSKSNSFVMPVVQELRLMEDINVRCQRMGLISTERLGFACLDSRNVLAMGI